MLFTHEANHMEIAGLFFEPNWWQSRGLENVPPGLVGGGSGIGLYVSDKGFFRAHLVLLLRISRQEILPHRTTPLGTATNEEGEVAVLVRRNVATSRARIIFLQNER
jgi:hypothetical protein